MEIETSLQPDQKELGSPFNFSNDKLQLLSSYIRRGVFDICIKASNGHIGGSSSSVELMTVLYFGGILEYNNKDLRDPDRDRVLVRGHLGPLRYSIFSLLGEVKDEELQHYRRLSSRLQGHEEYQQVPGVDITPSGSLGMLLSYGVGSCLAAREMCKDYKTYVFLGDGEEQEGNISEAARHAANLGLNNLVVIMDKNGKQLSDPVKDVDQTNVKAVWEAYGWNVSEICNGHNIEEIKEKLQEVKNRKSDKPSIIIANTKKGFGLDGAEDHFSGYHTIGTCPPDVPKMAYDAVDRNISSQKANVDEIIREIRFKGYNLR